jgi:hypothetical protein
LRLHSVFLRVQLAVAFRWRRLQPAGVGPCKD